MPERMHTTFVEPAAKKQKYDPSQQPRKRKRSAPSQQRRNLERVKRFKEKNGIPDEDHVPTSATPEALSLPPKTGPSFSASPADTPEHGKELRAIAASLLRIRRSLPIAAHEKAIREALRQRDVLVLVGETGSGKSTQLPQYLQSESWCRPAKVSLASSGGQSSEQPSDHEADSGIQPASVSAADEPHEESLGEVNGERNSGLAITPNTEKLRREQENRQPSRQIGGCIAVTEPRRVAATTLARRVAREMGTPLGKASRHSRVGYSVRFDDNSSPSAKVKYLTDGMLLQEILRDPSLSRYSAVVVDEVHERGVNVDLLLGLLKKLLMEQKDLRMGVPLKVIIMSATADAKELLEFFGRDTETDDASGTQGEDRQSPNPEDSLKTIRNSTQSKASQLEVGGRQHPVRIVYTPRPVQDIIEAALLKIFEINFREPLPGDILVFMTGQSTVESLCTLVQEYNSSLSKSVPLLLALPLYAALPQEAQQGAFDPVPPVRKGQRLTRKVIVSTNIAETSVTIPGVRYVVDGGKEKVKQYRPNIGLESLLTKPISQSAAIQRAGRAGRESAGICYRLYKDDDFHKLTPASIPEILRSDLAQAYLFLFARGISATALNKFPLIAQPSRAATEAALIRLHRLGAIDDEGKVIRDGKLMASLPVSVAMARVLLQAASPDMDCLEEAIDLVSAMSGEDMFIRRRELESSSTNAGETAEITQESGLRDEYRRADSDHSAMIRAVRGFAEEQSDRRAWAKERGLSWRALKEIMRIRKQLLSLAPKLQAHYESSTSTRSGNQPEQNSVSGDAAAADIRHKESLLRCLLAGFPANVAVLDTDNRYRIVGSRQEIVVHPSSALHARTNQSVAWKANKPAAIIYSEYVYTSRAYARAVSPIDIRLLLEFVGQGSE